MCIIYTGDTQIVNYRLEKHSILGDKKCHILVTDASTAGSAY